MPTSLILILGLVVLSGHYLFGYVKAFRMSRTEKMASRPAYYGSFLATSCLLYILLFSILWYLGRGYFIDLLTLHHLNNLFTDVDFSTLKIYLMDIKSSYISNQSLRFEELGESLIYYTKLTQKAWALFSTLLLLVLALFSYRNIKHITPHFKAREYVEKRFKLTLLLFSSLAIAITVGIICSLLFEALKFFDQVNIFSFLFGLNWSPQSYKGPHGEILSSAFGLIPVLGGTLLISVIALLIAGPIGLMTAIYLCEYAPKKFRKLFKPCLEILAGIPTVVYGFFASLVVSPFLQTIGQNLGLSISSEAALNAGIVIGIMIIPFISSISDDVIHAVPKSLREGAYGLGSTKSETIRLVILPAAFPGILSGLLLAISRAMGETMIVLMAAGLSARLTLNPFDSATTVTVQIASLMIGDQEFNSPKTLSAFALGLVLFILTLCLNAIALYISRKFQKKYQ